MSDCIEAMAGAFIALARGEAILPLRPILWLPEHVGALGMMPAYLSNLGMLGLKVVSVFPGNDGTQYHSHQGTVTLFEAEHGQLLAIIEASEVTAIRTGAVSGLATRVLAREDAGDLAILGSGVEARTHLEAMLRVRKIRRVRVWSRTGDRARAFAARESRRHGIEIEPVEQAREAVVGADIICTTTAATTPIVHGAWLEAGTHINAIGSSVPFTRELDTAAVARSRLFVDRRESTLRDAGDFLLPKSEGAIGDDHIRGEIGEILLGQVPGRTSAAEITLFESVGLAIEDLAAAHLIYRRAMEKAAGLSLELAAPEHSS